MMHRGALLLAALALAAAPAGDPNRGRELYLRGGDIVAVTDAQGTAIPASVLPCVNCHGHDGRGKREGGVTPSNLQWSELTKPRTTTSRAHPPYTVATLKRAFAMGIDPAGNALDATMPRYRMSLRQADDLAAFLQTLGTTTDPGITDKSLRIGVLLPPDREKAAAVREIVQAFVAQSPEVYGRRLEVHFLVLPSDTTARAAAVQSFLAHEQVFALVASSLLGAESSIARVIEESDTPTLASFAATVADDAHYMFTLLAGTPEQLSAVRAHDPGALVFEDQPDALAAFLRDAAAGNPSTNVYVPVSLASAALFDAPPVLDRRLFVVAPSWTNQASSSQFDELRALAPNGGASRSTQALALASMKVFAEALRRTGRDLSRDAIVDTLEHFYNFSTGLTPPLSFGPTKHTGTTGTFVLEVDREKRTLRGSKWIE